MICVIFKIGSAKVNQTLFSSKEYLKWMILVKFSKNIRVNATLFQNDALKYHLATLPHLWNYHELYFCCVYISNTTFFYCFMPVQGKLTHQPFYKEPLVRTLNWSMQRGDCSNVQVSYCPANQALWTIVEPTDHLSWYLCKRHISY